MDLMRRRPARRWGKASKAVEGRGAGPGPLAGDPDAVDELLSVAGAVTAGVPPTGDSAVPTGKYQRFPDPPRAREVSPPRSHVCPPVQRGLCRAVRSRTGSRAEHPPLEFTRRPLGRAGWPTSRNPWPFSAPRFPKNLLPFRSLCPSLPLLPSPLVQPDGPDGCRGLSSGGCAAVAGSRDH